MNTDHRAVFLYDGAAYYTNAGTSGKRFFRPQSAVIPPAGNPAYPFFVLKSLPDVVRGGIVDVWMHQRRRVMKITAVFGIILFIGVFSAALPPAAMVGTWPGPGICIAAESGTDVVEHYTGYLTSRMERVGSRSEGPEYYLETPDGRTIHVVKNANLWEEDPALQKYVGKKVWIGGSLTNDELYYTEIKAMFGD